MARTAAGGPVTAAHAIRVREANAVDTWMAEDIMLFGHYVKRQTAALWIIGAPAFLPMVFMLPAFLTLNGAAMNTGEADTLGTGSEILLIMTLLVTPMATLARQRWFIPLRRFYGIMFAVTAFTDAITASITTSFAGGVFGRLAGHSFLVVGFIMIMLLIPLFLTANSRAQKLLGRYWKQLHRLVYVIWGLLILHLTLLEGFGFQSGANGSGNGVDGTPIFHQRMYQFVACSLFLFVLRLPPVKRWVAKKQKEGHEKTVLWALAPLILLFLMGFAYIMHEEFFKGIDMFRLHPSTE
jgi:DMSO/TMAO reductase YedYZ heme-binding membrane subunit